MEEISALTGTPGENSKEMRENVSAEVRSLGEISQFDLSMPVFQRPYCWKTHHVASLLSDLKEAFSTTPQMAYQMGSIILHPTGNERREVIDGQQRLTTLAILLFHLGEKAEMGKLGDLQFSHEDSLKSISATSLIINDWKKKKSFDPIAFRGFVLKTQFLVIQVPRLEDAFKFFDCQNNRGKPLEGTDLLKAGHLRYVKDDDLQKECSQFWEKLDREGNLPRLIESTLGRARQWARQETRALAITEEFKPQLHSPQKDRFFPLNHYNQPPLFSQWRYVDREKWDADDGLEYVFRDVDLWHGTRRLKFVDHSVGFLPFQIPQALLGGEQFFLYCKKYHFLFEDLFDNPPIGPLREIRDLFGGLRHNAGVGYLFSWYQTAMLFFYDKYGEKDIEEVALLLVIALFVIRFEKGSIQNRSIQKLVNEGFNPVLAIHQSAFPGFVIDYLVDFCEGKEKGMVLPESGIQRNAFERLYGKTNGLFSRLSPEKLQSFTAVKGLVDSWRNLTNEK